VLEVCFTGKERTGKRREVKQMEKRTIVRATEPAVAAAKPSNGGRHRRTLKKL
jgi:hypothetical protein